MKFQKLQFLVAAMLLVGAAGSVLADGKALYDAKCAMCHGKDGKGNAAMTKALAVDPAHMDIVDKDSMDTPDDKWVEIILKGIGKMKGVAGLTEKQAAEITAYVRSIAESAAPKEKKSEAKPAAPAAAKTAGTVTQTKAAQIYKAQCASCHGADGKGNAALSKAMKMDMAGLDLTDEATLAKTDEELDKLTLEGIGKMPAYKGKLTPEEVNALTQYFRHLATKTK